MPLRLLADENIAGDVVDALRQDGHDVLWAATGAPATGDAPVLQIAQSEGRVIVKFDRDFGELAFRLGLPASSGVVLFRLELASAAHAVEIICSTLRSRSDWAGHFSVVTEGRVRMTALS